MPRLPIPPGSLEIFSEAGRLQSFKKAASRLSLSTSAVSQAMRKLEERVGCTLFARSNNRLTLTPQGEELLQHVEEGLKHIRHGLDAVRKNNQRPLSFSSPPGIAAHLLGTALIEIMSRYATDIRIAADETPDFESYHDYDVAIVYGAGAQKLKDVESLGPDVFVPVCAPHLASVIDGAEALRSQLLLTNETNAVSWEDWFATNGIDGPNPRRLHYNRINYIMPALLKGVGVGLESMRLLSPQIESGELVICNIPGTHAIIRDLTFLYITHDEARRPRALEIANLIRERCHTRPGGFPVQ